MRILLECCLLSCVVYVDLLILFFLVFLPFFDFDLDIVCFFLSFSCGAMLSPRFRFLVRLYQHMIFIRTYADLTFLFQSVVYDLFQLLCELSSVSHLFSS